MQLSNKNLKLTKKVTNPLLGINLLKKTKFASLNPTKIKQLTKLPTK